MHQTEYKILSLFKQSPAKEFSTFEILKEVYSEEIAGIEQDLKDPLKDKEGLNRAKREKARLHRKLLYYLNKLCSENILKLIKEGVKGQKYFAMQLEDGEEVVIQKYRRKIVISNYGAPAVPVEGYEQQGIAHKFDTTTWISRVNSILMECPNFDNLNALYEAIQSCYSNINDVIGLNDFEKTIQENEKDKVLDFIRKIEGDARDYGKSITLILDATNFTNERISSLIEFVKEFAETSPKNINIIFDVNYREINDHSEFFLKVIEYFSNSRIVLYIKNQDKHQAPYMIGRAGPYTFNQNEWNIYKKQYQDDSKIIACSQAAIAVDVDKCFSAMNTTQFRPFITSIVKSLLSANSMQRRRSQEYFRNLVTIDPKGSERLFSLSNNYIRFWNYGWKEPSKDQSVIIELLKNIKTEIENFALSEEIIYQSCGLPTRFKVAFSCAFKDFNDNLSSEKFNRTVIKRIEDLHSKETKENIVLKEKIFQIFDGGDRLRLFKQEGFNPEELLREIGVMLGSYSIPCFCFDFGEVSQLDKKLTSFIS